jgi:hypothetical protein
MKPPKLYLIIEKRHYEKGHGTLLSLQAACKRAEVPCEQIVADETTLADIGGMRFEPGSLLYRISTSPKSTVIGSMLAALHSGVFTTIYYPKLSVPYVSKLWELCEQVEKGLQVIPTLIVDETWRQMDTAALNRRIADLGGFPVVLKDLGFSHGQGVRKVDTVEELQEQLQRTNFEEYVSIVRKYLADYRHFRVIVIDGEAVAASEYHKPANDFRTNASESPEVSALNVADIPADLVKLAIDSVAIRQSILGGVDILVDQSDQVGYLAEVNIPCYFPRTEGATGIDISGKLLAALLRKREKERG